MLLYLHLCFVNKLWNKLFRLYCTYIIFSIVMSVINYRYFCEVKLYFAVHMDKYSIEHFSKDELICAINALF